MDLKSEHNSSKKQDKVIEVLNRFFPENTNHLRERFSISYNDPAPTSGGIGGCDSLSKSMKTDAKQLAAKLIQLHQDYPFFFQDVDPNDPDLDIDRGFSTYEQLKRQTNGR